MGTMKWMLWTRWVEGGLCFGVLLCLAMPSQAGADSIHGSTGTTASNLLKASVNQYGVLIELEIDPNEAELALPHLIRRATKAEALPTATPKRSELRVEADGKPLAGWVEVFVKHKRVRRDPITGKPIDERREDDVLFLRVRYPFPSRPDELVLSPPMDKSGQPRAALGFVAFHDGVPVNELASLKAPQTLRLDWSNPFYSRFSRPSIGRKHEAPVNVFMYVEPHEVRAEVVGRVMDFAPFLDLPLDPDEEILPEAREELLAKLAWLLEHNLALEVDGTQPDPRLDRIHFITRDVHSANLVSAEERTPANNATVAAIFVYPVLGLPKDVRLRWELFGEHLPKVSASATDEREVTLHLLTREHQEMHWVNAEGRTAAPARLDVKAPRSQVQVPVLLACGSLLALAVALMAIRRRNGWLVVAAFAFFVLSWTARSQATYTVALSPQLRTPSGAEASPTIEALLYNIYRALDGPQDSGAHARLSASVRAGIVESIYREIAPSLQLGDHHSSRLRIHEVEMVDVQPVDAPGESDISYRCKWKSHGSVGHWGHLHPRTSSHDGVISLAPEQGTWKIARLDLLSAELELEP
jgi:hypothetical protein